MKRSIIGFRLDDEGDWIAELDCRHGQHVRHRPPFITRPWVVTAAGREEKLGTTLDCVLCDRMEWPEGLAAYRRTMQFDQNSVPAGLKRKHATRAGIWGRLHVVAGTLLYHVEAPVGRTFPIAQGSFAVIVPELPHRVETSGPAQFFVEFWRTPK